MWEIHLLQKAHEMGRKPRQSSNHYIFYINNNYCDKCHRPVSSTSATFCNDKALQDQRFLNSSHLNVSRALSDTRVFGSDTTFLSFNLLPPPETPEVNY